MTGWPKASAPSGKWEHSEMARNETPVGRQRKRKIRSGLVGGLGRRRTGQPRLRRRSPAAPRERATTSRQRVGARLPQVGDGSRDEARPQTAGRENHRAGAGERLPLLFGTESDRRRQSRPRLPRGRKRLASHQERRAHAIRCSSRNREEGLVAMQGGARVDDVPQAPGPTAAAADHPALTVVTPEGGRQIAIAACGPHLLR